MGKKAKAARPKRARAKVASAKPAPDPKDDGKRNAETGRFLPGHRFWRTRASSGPEPLFADGDALWAACDSYFCWIEANPLLDQQLVTYKGATSLVPVPKMRAMTKRGLCRFLGIERTTWNDWKKNRPDLGPAIEEIESVIWDQKFTAAAANLLNANIISRELGLADRAEMSGPDGRPIQVEDVTPPQPRAPSKEAVERMIRVYEDAMARNEERLRAGETPEQTEARLGRNARDRAEADQRVREALADPEVEDHRRLLVGMGIEPAEAKRRAELEAGLEARYFPGEDAKTRRRKRAAHYRKSWLGEEPRDEDAPES